MYVHNGLSKSRALNESSLLTAVSQTVADNRNGWSDQDMADEWGVSAGTVNNAQNKRNALSLMNFLRLGRRFGPSGINTVLSLIGMRAVPDDAVEVEVENVPSDIATTLPLLIELLRDGVCCDSDVRALQQAGAIDKILNTADFLRQRRDQVRLQSVR